MPADTELYNPEGTTETSIPNLNEGSHYTAGRRSGGGMLSQAAAGTSPSAQPQPTLMAQHRTSASGGVGGSGNPRPVEPNPNPRLPPANTGPTGQAPTGSTSPPPGARPQDPGPTDPPQQTQPTSAPPPGSVRSAHTDPAAPNVNDPDNWAYGLQPNEQGNAFYDPRTGYMYDRFGTRIGQSHTGPTQSVPYDPGDGIVYPTPGGSPTAPGAQWGVNPIDWFSSNVNPINIQGSSVSLEGMLLGAHQAQQSEGVDVGQMAGANASLAPGTDVSGLTGPGAANIDSGPDAQASGYDAHTQEVDPTQTASGQMAEILSQDSPLMQRARQEGLLITGQRGLQNSSIAVGTALGSMVDRAQPLALANAQQYQQQNLANQAALNAASEFNATWENQMEQMNKSLRSQESIAETQLGLEGEIAAAQIRSAESQFNAELATQNAQFNAQWANQARMLQAELSQQNNQFNAAQQNQIDSHIMQLNTALNEQYLRGSQALDLATIQGQFSALISQNQTAASLFASHLSSIGQVMANHEISPATIASYVEIQQNLLQSALQLMADMNNIQFDDDLFQGTAPDGAPGTGGAGIGSEIMPRVSH